MFRKLAAAITALAILLATPSQSATQKWIAGAVSSYTNICTTDLNSRSSGEAILCSTAVANDTNLDLFATFSIGFASVASGANTPSITISIYPLNKDGSTYGDGLFASAAAGPPSVISCQIPVPPSVTAAIVGTGSCGIPIPLPPTAFKIVVWNNAGVALASSGNVVQYRTFNYQSN